MCVTASASMSPEALLCPCNLMSTYVYTDGMATMTFITKIVSLQSANNCPCCRLVCSIIYIVKTQHYSVWFVLALSSPHHLVHGLTAFLVNGSHHVANLTIEFPFLDYYHLSTTGNFLFEQHICIPGS